MKMLAAASTLLLAAAAASQPSAAPVTMPTTGWFQGSYACTIAGSPKQKLFVTLSTRSARAAVRDYPYYGQTEFKTLLRIGAPNLTTVNYRGPSGFLSLHRSTPGVLTGTGRIGRTFMQLTCAKS